MANFYVVYDEQEQGGDANDERKYKSAKLLGEAAKIARFTKLEAGSVAEAQEAVRNLFPGNAAGLPVVVAEAAWKTS
jgi:hypothetical protein